MPSTTSPVSTPSPHSPAAAAKPQPAAAEARRGEAGVVLKAVGAVVIVVVQAAWLALWVYLLATLVSWVL